GRGSPLPPRPSTREAAPPCPPSRVGELRVNCGGGRSRRDSDSAANAPTRFYPDFPPPGLGEMGGGLLGGAEVWTGRPRPHPQFMPYRKTAPASRLGCDSCWRSASIVLGVPCGGGEPHAFAIPAPPHGGDGPPVPAGARAAGPRAGRAPRARRLRPPGRLPW